MHPYQALGIVCVASIALAFTAGIVYPDLYKSFAIYENAGNHVEKKGVGNVDDDSLKPEEKA